jgi:uncharacterized peroxidase-related enzyme
VTQIQTDFRRAKVDPATFALLDYAERATLDATTMTAADIERLRQLGFSDEAILDAVSIMGFFQMANFHADVLGVELNPEYGTMRKVEMSATTS